jgi:transposase-like protein
MVVVCSAVNRPSGYVYVWADGIYLQARLEDTKQCILVIIGATPEGKRSCSASPTAHAKARRIGESCCSTCRTEAWRPLLGIG